MFPSVINSLGSSDLLVLPLPAYGFYSCRPLIVQASLFIACAIQLERDEDLSFNGDIINCSGSPCTRIMMIYWLEECHVAITG